MRLFKAIDNTSKDGDMDGDGEITEADIQALTALGEMEGQILPAEREIIDSLLDFSDRPIKEIMTPRVDVLVPLNSSRHGRCKKSC